MSIWVRLRRQQQNNHEEQCDLKRPSEDNAGIKINFEWGNPDAECGESLINKRIGYFTIKVWYHL